MPKYFQINQDDVVHELIDGEAILINMKTGSYYSLDQSGAVAWEQLQQGPASSDSIATVFSSLFAGDRTEMQETVESLLEKMLSEGLVHPTEASGRTPDVAPRQDRPPFIPPVLQIYTDLEALLLLDPIHDVSGEGWPIQNNND